MLDVKIDARTRQFLLVINIVFPGFPGIETEELGEFWTLASIALECPRICALLLSCCSCFIVAFLLLYNVNTHEMEQQCYLSDILVMQVKDDRNQKVL